MFREGRYYCRESGLFSPGVQSFRARYPSDSGSGARRRYRLVVKDLLCPPTHLPSNSDQLFSCSAYVIELWLPVLTQATIPLDETTQFQILLKVHPSMWAANAGAAVGFTRPGPAWTRLTPFSGIS